MAIIINNALIFDGSGAASRRGAVRIEGERIARIAYGDAAIEAGAGDQLIDADGDTLMPGLVEGHAHLSWGSSIEKIYHQFILPRDELKVATWRNARVLLDSGFTSAYSAGALADGLEAELKAEIDAGTTPGPRLVPSTIERSPAGADGIETGDVFNGNGPDAMRAFIAHCQQVGVEAVKLVISGENALKPGSAQDILYSNEELEAITAAAHAAGIALTAHCYTPQAIRMALDSGVRTLYHCSWADAASLDLMEAHKARIFYGPAIGVIVATLEAAPPPHIDMSAMKASAQEVLDLDKQLVPELKRRGVRIVIGGDYGFPFNPNGTNARDLVHFVTHFGFTPAEALSAATRTGGELMGMGDELGMVAPGYLADLLLVRGDPTQDVALLLDRNNLRMIMKGGQLYKSDSQPSAQPAATRA